MNRFFAALEFLFATGVLIRHVRTPVPWECQPGAGSALFLLFEVGNRLINPQPIERSAVGIAVMVFSIVVTVLLVLYQRRVIRERYWQGLGRQI